MKAIAISEMNESRVWNKQPANWHYSTKNSENTFHPVTLPHENAYKSSSRSTGVSRSLFGPSDPSESRRVVYEEMSSRRQGDMSRWNFDFYQEKPMAGRYDWKSVIASSKDRSSPPIKSSFESKWASSKVYADEGKWTIA